MVDAVDCALAFQAKLAEEEEAIPAERRILYRAGINLGDIVIDGDDILGDGVNLAAELLPKVGDGVLRRRFEFA